MWGDNILPPPHPHFTPKICPTHRGMMAGYKVNLTVVLHYGVRNTNILMKTKEPVNKTRNKSTTKCPHLNDNIHLYNIYNDNIDAYNAN